MGRKRTDQPYKVVAKDCTFGACPAILEGASHDDIVIVGKLDEAVLNSDAVRKMTGAGEIAVVIPRKLLEKAAKSLGRSQESI